jgi:septal ring factor EnvC (AmiA/AmiB activator)
MKALITFLSFFLIFALAIPVNADGKDELKQFYSKTADKVKATENADEKREILNESFNNMSNVLDKVLSSVLISESDRVGIEQYKATLQEKQNELEGINGYERVQDSQLNSFANYVVQDMEQADSTITISVIALLLIIIIVILLV